jgi:hypothetical protein
MQVKWEYLCYVLNPISHLRIALGFIKRLHHGYSTAWEIQAEIWRIILNSIFIKACCKEVDWFEAAQGRMEWWAVLNILPDPSDSIRAEHLFTNLSTFQGRPHFKVPTNSLE